MSFKKIKFVEPVEKLSGKKNKSSKLCFFQGRIYGQRGWGTGERNLLLRPYSAAEKERHDTFTAIAKKVTKRMSPLSATYMEDMAAFLAQRDMPGGVQMFRQWLWADEKAKLNA